MIFVKITCILLEDGSKQPKHVAVEKRLPIKDNSYIKSVA
jgi:hypothetical protein